MDGRRDVARAAGGRGNWRCADAPARQGLSEKSLATIADVVERVRDLEGLPRRTARGGRLRELSAAK